MSTVCTLPKPWAMKARQPSFAHRKVQPGLVDGADDLAEQHEHLGTCAPDRDVQAEQRARTASMMGTPIVIPTPEEGPITRDEED
jgi:hypothetical protein